MPPVPLPTALVVDDEPGVRVMLGRALGAFGFSVLEAHNGHEALALADAHAGSIHVLVTDVEMPGLTGVELARALGMTRPELPVLFVSGRVGPGALAEAVRDRPASYLAKPFSIDALRRALVDLAGPLPATDRQK